MKRHWALPAGEGGPDLPHSETQVDLLPGERRDLARLFPRRGEHPLQGAHQVRGRQLDEWRALVFRFLRLARERLPAQLFEHAELAGHRVRVVGIVRGLKGLSAPYVFCSIDTARQVLGYAPDQITFALARCCTPEDASRAAQRLQKYEDVSAFTSSDFSRRTRLHWITQTKGGIATTFTALLSLLVGAVVRVVIIGMSIWARLVWATFT